MKKLLAAGLTATVACVSAAAPASAAAAQTSATGAAVIPALTS
ncbi:hypothetical protein [Microbispora sp. H10830]|nr:hypothetical protein [Microbispora sp. H10830]